WLQRSLVSEVKDRSRQVKATKYDITARELVNPQKSWAQVDKEAQEGHPLYVLTHNDYKPEEQVDRKYSWTRCNKYSTFGIQTPHFNDGRNIKKPLNWLQEEQL
uniref:Uncharacterized protein n=1 Tax=Callorhinchus milii TaxID=7868 RepID=A0A4W3KGI7_CALMI